MTHEIKAGILKRVKVNGWLTSEDQGVANSEIARLLPIITALLEMLERSEGLWNERMHEFPEWR